MISEYCRCLLLVFYFFHALSNKITENKEEEFSNTIIIFMFMIELIIT